MDANTNNDGARPEFTTQCPHCKQDIKHTFAGNPIVSHAECAVKAFQAADALRRLALTRGYSPPQ